MSNNLGNNIFLAKCQFTWAPAEGTWRPVTEVTADWAPMAPLPGTTAAPASAIFMTLASSTLFMTMAKALLNGAPRRLHQDHFYWIGLENHEEESILHHGSKI